jgi:hypothetical protein
VTIDDAWAVTTTLPRSYEALDVDELRELVVDAWRMCVPKKQPVAHEG